jgi:hypothetical protein
VKRSIRCCPWSHRPTGGFNDAAVLPIGGLEVWALASLLMATTVSRSWSTLTTACLDGEDCPTLAEVSSRQTIVGVAAMAALTLALVGGLDAYG